MKYADLREFLAQLEARGDLKRITVPVSPRLEMTEVSSRVLQSGGPALLFEKPAGHDMPVLANLFGTVGRVAAAMGAEDEKSLREIGRLLAYLKEPEPPTGLRDLWDKFPLFKQVLNMAPKTRSGGACQEIVWEGSDVDLARLPVQTCWPGDAGPLITWGLTVTRGPAKKRRNLGIYRQQVIGAKRLIMRWLAHRGGALDYQDHLSTSKDPFPVAVAIGADPATLLAAVTPVPDTLGEYQFAGLLRGARTELVRCISHDLEVPASAEIVLEGFIHPGDVAAEGPHGDHTGYYNEVERFPVMSVERITMRRQPIYHSTYTGKPPDEPSVLGLALNEVFVPLLQRQFPEIVDFYLPPEACSYRLAVVTMKKQELPAAVHVHQIHHRLRRRHRCAQLEGSGLGDEHTRRSGARHRHRRADADRLSRLRQPGCGPGLEDGPRRARQVARGNFPALGPADRRGSRGEAAGGRYLERPRLVGPL